MFSSIEADNVQEAYVRGLALVRSAGVLQETRNGSVLVIPWPVMTVYAHPMERVLLDPRRDANPFFHLLESMWMLAGRDDVASLEPFNAGLKRYSDDGEVYHGAYGKRWRGWFPSHMADGEWGELDQLRRVIELIRANPADRRIVVQMWDPTTDLGQTGQDFPCNTNIYLRVRDGFLDMTVCNRSNDAVWGAYGANAVHMSVLQEFVAAACGLLVGRLYQLSNNLHGYTETMDKVGEPQMYTRRDVGEGVSEALVGLTMYDSVDFQSHPLFRSCPSMPVDEIFRQVDAFWAGSDSMGQPEDLRDFFTMDGLQTLIMTRASYLAFKTKEYDRALSCARDIPASDWRRACVEWLERRAAGRDAKAAQGEGQRPD